MKRRILTREEAEDSIRALAKTIHENADALSVTERESLVNAVLVTAQNNQPVVTFTRKSNKNQPKQPSKIWRSR